MSSVVDYKEFVAKLVPEQFKRAYYLNRMLEVLYAEFEKAEDMLEELRRIYDIDSADGALLDALGVYIGTPRNTDEDDTSYRSRLKVGALYGGVPTPSATINIVKNISGSEKVGYYPCYPAGFYVVPDRMSKRLFAEVDSWVASGVECMLGTFLRSEDSFDVLVGSEDVDEPIVVDSLTDAEFYGYILDFSGNKLIDDDGNPLVYRINLWGVDESEPITINAIVTDDGNDIVTDTNDVIEFE